MENIYIENGYNKFPAEWVEEFSSVDKDISILRIKNTNFKPLECAKEAMPELSIFIWGFSAKELDNFPNGSEVKSRLYDTPFSIRWREEQIQGSKKWNKKPQIDVNVYRLEAKLDKGFSGAPVCYSVNTKVVGMLTAKDENHGYVVPIEIILDRFHPSDKFQGKKQISTSLPYKIDSILDKGNQYLESEDYSSAIEYYDKIINNPNLVSAWNNKGLSFYHLKRYDEARECFDKALEIDSSFLHAWNNKGNALFHLNEYEKAINCYQKVIEIDPNYADAWYNKGLRLYHLGKYYEAIASYDKTIEIDPNYVEAWYNKGDAYYRLGRIDEAIKCMDKVLGIDPNDVDGLNYKAWLFANSNRNKEALSLVDKSLEICSDNADALDTKGFILYNLEQYEESIKFYDKAIGIDPNDVDLWKHKVLALNKIVKGETFQIS